jgi:hypothetical protein
MEQQWGVTFDGTTMGGGRLLMKQQWGVTFDGTTMRGNF